MSYWTCISFDYICIKSMSYVLSIVLKSETNNVYLVFVLLNTSSHMKYISLQASPSNWNLFTMTKCMRRRMLHVFLLFNCILTVVHIQPILAIISKLVFQSILNTNRPTFIYIWMTNWCEHYLFLHHCYTL